MDSVNSKKQKGCNVITISKTFCIFAVLFVN